MASNVSTVDGMGFEEVNQNTSTETISGTNIYGTTISGNQVRVNDLVATDDISANVITVDEGQLYSASYQNAADVYGARVRAGSVEIGDDSSGLISFADDWVGGAGGIGTDTYFITLTPRNWTIPVASVTGSVNNFSISGTRRASGCWAFGPSGTVADWIAVGI